MTFLLALMQHTTATAMMIAITAPPATMMITVLLSDSFGDGDGTGTGTGTSTGAGVVSPSLLYLSASCRNFGPYSAITASIRVCQFSSGSPGSASNISFI